jgi:glycosyltransferase involved in cell wall biosynthesis
VNYEVVQIGRGNPTPRLGYLMHGRELYGALRAQKPDVIYQRVACGYTGVAAYYAQRTGTPMVWHVAHESDVERETRILGRNPVRACLERKSIEYGLRNAKRIVVQTAVQERLLFANYGRRADAVVRNFHPAPQERLDRSGPPSILWVANLKPWKQPEVFVRLAGALRDIKDVRFTMVGAPPSGSGDRRWNEELLTSIRELPNLEYLGMRSQSEVNSLMASAHVFVNTSRQEGFPNTFIQAWMRGVPVVSLSVSPDGVLERERIGVLAGSEGELAGAVRRLLLDSQWREQMGRRARDYALSKHSLDNVDVLVELLAEEAANRALPRSPSTSN